jgi:hypothetical protein
MRRAIVVLATVALALLGAQPASAAFGLKELDVNFTDQSGSTASQAGSHPFAFTTTLGVNTAIEPEVEVPEGEVKDLEIGQIRGLVGSQSAMPRCSSVDFNFRVEGRASCPDATAVGFVAVRGDFNAIPLNTKDFLHVPLYNLVPSPGAAAKLGFVVLGVPIVIDVGVSPKPPYNLVAKLDDVPQAVLFYSSQVTIWGNPASPAHNLLRGKCVGDPFIATPAAISLGSCAVNVPEAAFLTLPRSCQGPLSTVFTADSWTAPGVFTEPLAVETHNESVPPSPLGMTGCAALNFGPTIDAKPTSSSAESPSGIDVSLDVKDEGLTSPTGRAQSDIRKVELTLPAGVTANPSAAEGLGVCTKAQYEAASLTVPGCPEAAKLGSVQVRSPLLEETLEGGLYIASPDDPGTAEPKAENPFDSLLALYIVIRNAPNGIFIEQAVEIEPDPKTGRLVSTVEGIPELPFSHFNLHFREGPRSPLTTPPLCGTYATKAILTPWSGNDAIESTSSFKVSSGPGGGPCPSGSAPPFHPGFEAGTLNNNAGSYSPLYMHLTRQDGEADMTRFDALLPPGLVPKLAGVSQCPDSAIEAAKAKSGRVELADPSCPASSQIGRVLGGAGVGPALTYVPGKIYLAGPFGGDPLSVVVIVPAVAGPFDVGTVVVREAINLNPVTYRGEIDGAASDPIPHILKGIPLKLRDLRVYADRPNFILNPTSCDPESVGATIFGAGADLFNPADDTPAALSAHFQAVNCGLLGFKPKLSLKLVGGTKRDDHPALRSVLIPRPGDANIGKAVVILPPSEFIDNDHINNPCTRVQFNANQCPKKSVLGRARAVTPLLSDPLEGPVYFRSNGGERLLPDIVADLRGQFHVILIGAVDAVDGRLRTTFRTTPDAPVTKFTLKLNGGKKGLLVNSADLCAHRRRVQIRLSGQNGKLHETRPVLGTDCRSGKKQKRQKPSGPRRASR